ncbi:MAG: LLM class flavin-dependent oxidoreductase [Deltaproteobacteria bacterium]|nr:LLM class flavin-dependent oxidoreductase [Deltaproteobacteria bacterium]MBI3389404.1 LLM class flavin-dependent oxidoreductase [Deltaproteobacteria bacterium]
MEFGIFSQMHVPPWDDEHSRYLRELEVSQAVDAVGFKYDWAPEHHFLQHYSHQPAPEVFLSWVAARTTRIHVGTAITNITAAVNHPARVAERIATMDHLSEGRVEFGTGRGSSSAEWGGFAIPSAAETKPMWRESLEQIPLMWRDEPYAFEGKYFRMPERNVLPKPYTRPHPPMWLACSSPNTFAECGELGLGCLCFTFGTPTEIAAHVRAYKDGIKRCKQPVGAYINDNIAVTTNMFCLEDGDEARRLYADAKVERFTEYFLQWLDSIPRPKGLPPTGPVGPLPQSTPEQLKAGLAAGGRQIGSPEEIAKVVKMYDDIGVDQLIYAPLTLTLDQKHVLRSIEAFGKHVLPKFDKDPVHSTRRQREAQLAAKAA